MTTSSELFAQRPSLDWALFKITGEWPANGEMISCPLPGHDDSTPSFNLWDPDAEGLPQRFGCFGCGRNGDVMSLISELEGLQGAELARRAEELAAEEAASPQPQRKAAKTRPRKVVDFAKVIAGLEKTLSVPRFDHFQKYMDAKGLGDDRVVVYALDTWGWVPADRGVVAVPHRGPDGEITGIKYRSADRKWSAEGSRYPFLYGTWLDQGRSTVVLCEGESDTVWASFWLRSEPVDVLGLPSGANQQIIDEWRERLKGRKLILVFDQDEAGMNAATSWTQLRTDALLARLPEGKDLLGCGIPVHEVLSRAAIPKRTMGLIDLQGGVLVRSGANNAAISDFGLRPRRELITEDGPAWEVGFVGRPGDTIIRPRDLLTSTKMRTWANSNGCSWLGNDKDVGGLFNWLGARSAFLPLEETVSKAGKVRRSFVGPGFCIGPDQLRYVQPVVGDARLSDKIKIEEGLVDTRAVAALEQLNNPSVMAIILGWLCATLMRGERPPAPPLFISGESGAGKTSMINVLLSSFGFHTEMTLTTTTPYGVDCMINSCIGFPIWFDEYRGGAREDSMTRLRQILRDAYFGQASIKGGMTQQVTQLTEISTWAGIIVSGEMGAHETSLRERMIMLDLGRDDRNQRAMEFLKDRSLIAGLGYELLRFLSGRPDVLFRPQPAGPETLPDRLRAAMGFVQAGWEAWKHFRWEQGLYDVPVEPDFNELASVKQQIDDPYLEAIRACEGMTTRDGSFIVTQEEDGSVLLIPGEVVVESKRLGIELPARAQELRSWLRARWDTEDFRGPGRRRCIRVRGLSL